MLKAILLHLKNMKPLCLSLIEVWETIGCNEAGEVVRFCELFQQLLDVIRRAK